MMTPWFPPHINPARKGVYEIKYTERGSHESYMYATWNGKKWSRPSHKLFDEYHKQFDGNQNKYWRGLTKEQT